MRTRRSQRSTEGRASFALTKSLGTITFVVSACASILGGACGDAQPNTATTSSSGAGGTMSSSSTGDGGDGLSNFVTSSNVGASSSSASSSSGGPVCPNGDPNGGPTKVAAAYGDTDVQTGSVVTYDKSGNLYMAGAFAGSINVGGTALTSAGATDVFVAKFNTAGQVVWAKRYGDNKVQNPAGIAVDATGNVYVTGNFLGNIDFGGGALTAAGTLFTDIYLAKLDPNGGHIWSKRFGDDDVQNARALAVDSNGNVIVGGSFKLTVNFGGGTLTAPGGTFDAFVAKFDATGAHQWSYQYGDDKDQFVNSVAIDATANVYIAGDLAGTTTFGGVAQTATQNPSAFVAKLDPLGNTNWVKLSNGTAAGVGKAFAVSVGTNGDVAVAGTFNGTFDMGGMPINNNGTDDAFVTLLSNTGAHKYTKSYGDLEAQSATGVAIAPNGEVFVAGDFNGAIDLGNGDITSAGQADNFLARLDATGCPKWTRVFGGPLAQSFKSLALDPTTAGGLAITGSFVGTVDFGNGPLTASGQDAFLLTVNP